MNYSENELPRQINHEQMVTLNDGTVVRFETNGEAKDVFLGDAFNPNIQLFPGNEFEFEAGGKKFKVTAEFSDVVTVSKV